MRKTSWMLEGEIGDINSHMKFFEGQDKLNLQFMRVYFSCMFQKQYLKTIFVKVIKNFFQKK